MSQTHQNRTQELQQRMTEDGVDIFVTDDPDSVFCFSGYWGYVGLELGRPTIIVIPRSGEPTLITPAMEGEMARAMTWVRDIREWADGIDGEWTKHLSNLLNGPSHHTVMLEPLKSYPKVVEVAKSAKNARFVDGTALIISLRMVKTPEEIAVMRQAGKVAVAMVEAGRAALIEGVPEYEVAIAIIAAGTRKAAEFLSPVGKDQFISPTIYNLQVMQSGHHTSMVHRRSSIRQVRRGDPVYFCFCGIANFKQLKLGFDREFFVGTVSDEHARIYEAAVRAQQTALSTIRPGVLAENVHEAAEEVYRSAGFEFSYRTGRGVGYSFLEEPQLKRGDKTRLEAGMTFAVDGGITIREKFGARLGDSIVVTETGFEYLTDYPRGLAVV
jgi:Xaa-Pro aminopeptidase